MRRFLKRLASAGVGVSVFVLLLMPVSAQASSTNVNSVSTTHIARALANARGVTHWTIAVATMRSSPLAGYGGRTGAAIPYNTVYGNCGSAWMAIGNQGGGHAWIALGWDINRPAYWEYWATGVVPAGSKAGSGPIPPWHSTSWDTGYSSWEGYWVWASGWAYMVAYTYGGGGCVSNGPSSYAFITP
jgi:hypothetical protein